MNFRLDKRFQKKAQGIFESYEFEVGILEDKPYRKPLRGERGQKGQDVLTKYAGTTVRKASRKNSDMTLSEISVMNRARYNYLVEPFRNMSPELKKLLEEFMGLLFGKTKERRLENTLQAIVRNPILKKEYGSNSRLTQTIKGFDHVMVDTAQFFKGIKARVRKVKRRGRG